MTTPTFRKSSASGPDGANCVEVAHTTNHIEVRDSKNPDGPRLTFTATLWRTLTAALLAGAPTDTVTHRPDGTTQMRQGRVALTFTEGEWVAFLTGVRQGEFPPPEPAELKTGA